MKPDNSVAFSDAELKKLEKKWYERMKNTDGIVYDYKQKELIKSCIGDIKKIANQNIRRFLKSN